MATHSSIPWEIPWTEKPGGLQSIGSQRVRHDLATKHDTRTKVGIKRTYGDWPFESSLVGRADFLEARAATRPTSPRCTASSSF